MTNLPSGNTRTSPIAGSLDGFDTDLRTALARLDRERRSSFARPGQRAEALERFTDAVAKALGKVRGQDRVAALAAQKDALDRAAVSTAKTITALERQLAKTVAEAASLREANTTAWTTIEQMREELDAAKAAEDELSEALLGAEGKLAMARDHVCDPLPQRVRQTTAPEVTGGAGVAPDGPRNDADTPGLPVRSPGKTGNTPRRTGRPGAAK